MTPEYDDDFDCDDMDDGVTCPACGGTGDASDDGSNMGECDECCGTGVLE